MAGKSFDHFIALPEASQESTGPAYAEVHLHPRDENKPVIVHRVLSEEAFDYLQVAPSKAAEFISNRLLDVKADGELVVKAF